MKTETRTARDRLDRILAIVGRATRFWVGALVVIVIGGLVSVAVAFTRPRVYKSETLMLYREGIRSSDLGGPDSSGGDPARKLGMKLKEMVLSRTRLQQIIDEFKLYPEMVADRGYVDAVDEMRNHISFRVKDGDTFGLSFEGEDPKRVQLVTARLAEALISENSKNRAEQAEVTKEFIDVEKQRIEGELREKETALAKFLVKHPEFAKENAAQSGGTQGAGSAIRAAQQSSNKPSKADPGLLALEREATRIQERLGMPVNKKKERETIEPKLLAERQAAEADLRAAQKDVENKLQQFTEQHPDVKEAKGRVRSAEARLKQALDAINDGMSAAQKKDAAEEANEGTIDRGALENELKRVNEEITAYKNKKRRQDGEKPETGSGSWIVAMETDWTRLNREVGEARERYQSLQDKQFKASMAETAATSGRNANMEIVDPAYKPTHPAKPSRSLIAAAGVAVSFALALALALGCALLDDRLYDRVDLERLEVARLLGVVPRAPKRGGARHAG